MTRDLDHLPQRDIERLSAYLDGELAPSEAQKLEARLQQEDRLRGGLQELKGTIGIMQRLPQVGPPRNYFLTPEMVGQRQPRWSYPVLQFATALAAVMFVVVLVVDAGTLNAGMMAGAPAAEIEAPMALQAAPTELSASAPEEEMRAMEAETAETEAAQEQAAEPGAGAAADESDAFQATPSPESMAGEGEAFEPPESARPEQESLAAPDTSADDEDRTGPLPWLRQPGVLRLVEIGLAGLIIVLGLLTYRMRPRRR